MENKILYAVQTITNHQFKGAIGYIPVFDDPDKAIAASDDNNLSIKKMIVGFVPENPKTIKYNKLLNKIQNLKL